MSALPLGSDCPLVFLDLGHCKQRSTDILGPAAVGPGLVISG